jgi:hypothetical protein
LPDTPPTRGPAAPRPTASSVVDGRLETIRMKVDDATLEAAAWSPPDLVEDGS